MRRLKLLLFLLLGIFVVFQSCKKKELEEIKNVETTRELSNEDMPDVTVKNGMLYFDNKEELDKVFDIILNMTEKELDDWERTIGFISVRTIQNQFYTQLESIDEDKITEEDVVRHVEKYSNFFKIVVNENGEKEIEAKIDINVLASICNVDNMYQVNNRITKVLENDLVSSDYTEKSVLENINDDNLENLKHDNKINIFQYRGRANQKTGCGSISQYYKIEKDEKWCRKDRKVLLRFEAWEYDDAVYDNQNNIVAVHVSNYARAKVEGRKKYACFWGGYKTMLDLKNCEFTVNDPENYDWTIKSFVISNYHIETRRIDAGVNLNKYWWDFSIYPNLLTPYFMKYKGEFSSRGVGNVWKVGSCGY